MKADLPYAATDLKIPGAQPVRLGGTEKEARYCRLSYSFQAGGVSYEAQGLTRDVSKTGCGILGNIIPSAGTPIRLTLDLLDREAPLSFEGTVTWTVGEFFEVRLFDVDVKDYTRIRRYLWHVLNKAT